MSLHIRGFADAQLIHTPTLSVVCKVQGKFVRAVALT